MILSDKQILQLCQEQEMITPFVDKSVKEKHTGHTNSNIKIISYGLSSYGYDLSLADEFKVYDPTTINCLAEFSFGQPIIDPKKSILMRDIKEQGCCIIPPNSFALGRSIEYIKMPRDVTGLATNKSTYARCGLNTPSTVLEAGWSGHLTIEMFNSTPHPIKVYAGEGIVQILFFKGEDCLTSYADRKGKYQGQKGITNAKI